jgi:predicted HNH restriction endonuclease
MTLRKVTRAARPISPRARHKLYLRSPAWLDLKGQAIARDGGRCRLCDSPYRLEVHHRRYRHRDTLDALTTLCATCHAAFHRRARAVSWIAVSLTFTTVALLYALIVQSL